MHIQHTAVGSRVVVEVDEASVTLAYHPLEYMAPAPSVIAVLLTKLLLVICIEVFVPST